MYLSELTSYKLKLIQLITSNEAIINLLAKPDEKSDDAESLVYKKIYPYGYIPDVNTEQDVFICFDVDVPRVRHGNMIKDVAVHIYVLAHKELMRVGNKLRIDALANEIDKQFDRNSKFGFDLLLVSAKRFMAAEGYYGLDLYFEAPDFNSTNGRQ